MNLNYTAFFLISLLPLALGVLWYHPNSPLFRIAGKDNFQSTWRSSPLFLMTAFFLSFIFVFGYINLVIHQMGFYELFFTDIMRGSEEAKVITSEFLAKYGDKHRHFMHGVFHGAINAFVFALPFTAFYAFTEARNKRWLLYHFSYWLVMSMLVGGMIAEFV